MTAHEPECLRETADEAEGNEDRTLVEIATHFLPKANALISRANRRLERAGVAERFSLEILGAEVVKTTNEAGVETFVEMTKARVSSPQIAAKGWEFVATAEWDDLAQAVLIYTNPSAEQTDNLPIPSDMRCDHCSRVRARRKCYLIRHTSGEFKVIGSSCVAPFLGLSVQALWWLNVSDDPRTALDGFGRGQAPAVVDRDQALALAWVLSNKGKDYKPSSFSDSTRTEVASALWPPVKEKPDERARREQAHRDAAQVPPEVVEQLVASVAKLEEGSSYGHTLRAIVAGQWVSAKNLGYLVSVVSVYRRQVEQDAPVRVKVAEAPTVTGLYAPEGTKIEGVAAVVTVRTSFSMDLEVGGADSGGAVIHQTSAVVVMRVNESGHLLKWISTSDAAFELGKHDEVMIERATVRELQVWQDQESTRIVRPKITITKAAEDE